MITIRVGSGATVETFVIHKELVAFHSTKLARMINDPIKVETPGVLELPGLDPGRFQIFEAWLYQQQLEDEAPNFFSTTALYMFGEEIGSSGLLNAVLEVMGHMVRDDPQWISTEPIFLEIIWNGTVPDSPLRTLIVDVLAYEMTAEDCSKRAREFPVDLLVRLLEAMKGRVPGRMKNEDAPFDESMEKYLLKEAE
ncbi:hypothetical protein MMC18_002935 [Xylographa bjoerkii]|nr:hypothetical protein [Xylographa bjoerkii]